MDELKPCPFCTSPRKAYEIDRYTGAKIIDSDRDFYLQIYNPDSCLELLINNCPLCGNKLNLRPTPENKPLTLEQLRQMDGEPVKVYADGEYQYGLVYLTGNCFAPKEEVITMSDGNLYLLREMVGNFKVYPVAYSRKLEQEAE